MGVVWGISSGIWIILVAAAFAGCLVIFRVLVLSFAALRDLRESLELSGRLVTAALHAAQEEADRASEALARLGRHRDTGSAESARADVDL